jgi:hypothetical protein
MNSLGYNGTLIVAACSLVTATVAAGHGYAAGDLVTITGFTGTGAAPNGTFRVFLGDGANFPAEGANPTTKFSYLAATVTLPGGTGTCKRTSSAEGEYQNVVSVTGDGTTATATVTAHGYASGTLVTIKGMTPSTLNGQFIVTDTGDDTFTYPNTHNGASTVSGQVKSLAEGFYYKQVLLRRGLTVTTN